MPDHIGLGNISPQITLKGKDTVGNWNDTEKELAWSCYNKGCWFIWVRKSLAKTESGQPPLQKSQSLSVASFIFWAENLRRRLILSDFAANKQVRTSNSSRRALEAIAITTSKKILYVTNIFILNKKTLKQMAQIFALTSRPHGRGWNQGLGQNSYFVCM